MPKGMRGFYRGELPDLFLEIYLHTGCHVQISRSDEHPNDKFSALEVSGTLASIQRARKILNESVRVESDTGTEAKGSMGSFPTTTTSIPIRKAMPRSVWSIGHTESKQLSDVTVPAQWSFKTFASHVEDLITSTAPRFQIREQGAPKSKPHVEAVTERIIALYTSKETVRWASMRATVQTLQYLSQHRKVPEVRRVLELIDSRSKTMPQLRMIFADPAIFNALLHSAAEALDLHNYNFLLRMMLDRDVAPDAATWTTLLHLVQRVHPRSAKHVMTIMRSKNMLSSPSAKIAAANESLQKDAAEWLGRAHYDKLWLGKEWLDTRACNQLLPLLIESGRLEDAMTLVGELESRHRRPNHVTTHILIGAASAYRNLEFAVRALEATMGQKGSGGLRPTCYTFDKLITLAYRLRAYNTLRVIWRYACLSSNASPSFVRKMQKSLLTPIPSTTKSEVPLHVGQVEVEENAISRNKYFKAMAAKVAVGIEKSMSVETIKQLIASATEPAVESPTAAMETAPVPDKPIDEGTVSVAAAVETKTPLNTAVPEQDITHVEGSAFETPAVGISLPTTEPAPATEAQKVELEVSPPTTPRSNKNPLPQAMISDLLAHKTHKAGLSFTTMFRRAVAKDMEWRFQGYDKHAPLDLLLREALDLNVEKKDGEKAGSKAEGSDKVVKGKGTEDVKDTEDVKGAEDGKGTENGKGDGKADEKGKGEEVVGNSDVR
ncbi:hypothetical protein E4T39_01516 [Aureobasidium subglaciale]|nr:hypothetical protein E4T39_01516 [Aureobasidium subglaciale]